MKKIMVVTSGQDAPGMNAAIYGLVRSASAQGLEIYGAIGGFQGILAADFEVLTEIATFPYLQRGGTLLQTSFLSEKQDIILAARLKASLNQHDFDALFVIGDGASFEVSAQLAQLSYPVVSIPATIANDISGTERSLGFATAVNNAVQAIDKLQTTADSHGHIFIVEVMGQQTGHIARSVGQAVGADMVLVPEGAISVEGVIDILDRNRQVHKSYSMIITAEGAISCESLAQAVEARSDHQIHPLALGYI